MTWDWTLVSRALPNTLPTRIYICVCVCVCLYIYMCVCLYIYIYICMHIYMCVFVYTHTYTHTHTHIYIYIYITPTYKAASELVRIINKMFLGKKNPNIFPLFLSWLAFIFISYVSLLMHHWEVMKKKKCVSWVWNELYLMEELHFWRIGECRVYLSLPLLPVPFWTLIGSYC